MPDEGYMDAAGIDTPDAGDDTLREQLATALTGLPPTAIYSDGTIKIVAEPVIDELMPVIRDHVAAAVQGERERVAGILDGCNERNARLAERLNNVEAGREIEQTALRNAAGLIQINQAALARVEGVLAEHWDWKAGRSLHKAVRAALDGTEATDGAR